MPELPPAPDLPVIAPPATAAAPEDQAAASFAAMDRESASAPRLSQILSCQKSYLEISFFDERTGLPIRRGTIKVDLDGFVEERPLDGRASYRIDAAPKDINALVAVVSAAEKDGTTEWRVEIGRGLTPMKRATDPSPAEYDTPPEAPWEPLGTDPWFKE